MPSAGRCETTDEANHRDELYDRWKDKEVAREMKEKKTIVNVWQKIDSQEYGTAWNVESVQKFQEDLREVFEPADEGEDWVKVWNFAVGTVEAFKTSVDVYPEKCFEMWMKFVCDVVLNYYYYFWDFDGLGDDGYISAYVKPPEPTNV